MFKFNTHDGDNLIKCVNRNYAPLNLVTRCVLEYSNSRTNKTKLGEIFHHHISPNVFQALHFIFLITSKSVNKMKIRSRAINS